MPLFGVLALRRVSLSLGPGHAGRFSSLMGADDAGNTPPHAVSA